MKLFKKERSCMKKTNSNVESAAVRRLQYSNRNLSDAMRPTSKEPCSPAGYANRPQKKP